MAIYESAALVEGTQAPLPYKISPVLSESHPGESFGTVCKAISSHRQSLKKGPYCRFGCGKVVKKDSQQTMWTNYLAWYLYLFRKSCLGFSPACRRSMPGRVSNHDALGHKKRCTPAVEIHYNTSRHEPTARGGGASEGCRPKLPRWPFSAPAAPILRVHAWMGYST